MRHILVVVVLMCSLALHATDTINLRVTRVARESIEGNVGVASWYGGQHQGKIMANGVPFDRCALTAASRTLPLGLWIHVINLHNGKSVDVQITDRGPNERLRDRILDLSERAANQLSFRREGLTVVSFLPLKQPLRTEEKLAYSASKRRSELCADQRGDHLDLEYKQPDSRQ